MEVDARDQLGLGRVRRALDQLGGVIVLLSVVLLWRFWVLEVWRDLTVCGLCVRLAWGWESWDDVVLERNPLHLYKTPQGSFDSLVFLENMVCWVFCVVAVTRMIGSLCCLASRAWFRANHVPLGAQQ